ncbi:hypothetical protein EV361DRAFT_576476 [Lentinula raphanica]|nr:hypothetical protein EV361DRAFT_576476 [Lentinula raphanica]
MMNIRLSSRTRSPMGHRHGGHSGSDSAAFARASSKTYLKSGLSMNQTRMTWTLSASNCGTPVWFLRELKSSRRNVIRGLNIRLDDLYIDLKRTHDPRASEYFNQIKEDLKNVKRLSQLTGVKIEDKSSYMRACFWRLKQVKMLRLTDQELKQNLDKPHRDLIYRDLSRNPRGAKKPALPLEEGGSSSDYSDKRQKLDTSTTSISSPGPSNQDSLDADHSNKGPIEPHPMSFAPVLPPEPVSENPVGAKRPAPPLEEGGSSSDQSDNRQKLYSGTTSISSAGPSNQDSHGADHSNEGLKEPHPMSFVPILRPEPVSNTKSVSAVADTSGSQRPDPMSFKNILHEEQVSNTKSTSLAGTSGDQRPHPMSLRNILNEDPHQQ